MNNHWPTTYQRRTSPKWNLFIKNCVFILTCLNFSHFQSTLHLMQYTFRGVFSHCLTQFLNSLILMPFSVSAVFCFTSSTWTFPFEGFFHPGIQKKVALVDRKGGARGSCRFWSKTAEHSGHCGWVNMLLNHPSWNGQIHWESSKKKKKRIHWMPPLTTMPAGTLIQMGS